MEPRNRASNKKQRFGEQKKKTKNFNEKKKNGKTLMPFPRIVERVSPIRLTSTGGNSERRHEPPPSVERPKCNI